jgi:carbon monoxide dehydrogenase subunit G
VHVDATPAEVWEVLARFDRLSSWAPDVDHSSYLTGQTEGVGTARRVQVGRMVLVERVTEWEPGDALAYDLEGLPPVVGGATNRWVLRHDGSGTDVTLSATVDPGVKPVGRLAARIVERRLARANDGLLAGLADHLRRTSA